MDVIIFVVLVISILALLDFAAMKWGINTRTSYREWKPGYYDTYDGHRADL